MSIADRLHERLRTLGHDVQRPKRIWLGRGHDNGDWWRWKAVIVGTSGAAQIGCNLSMRECVAMSLDELRQRIERN